MGRGLERLARIKGHFDPKNIVNKELFEEDFGTIENELEMLQTVFYVIPLEHFKYLRDIQKITQEDYRKFENYYEQMQKEIKLHG